ncbi:MAG: AsmA family protein [Paludibacteraceae bacterium]|nr:AsmA family protein [Paludibacteraceae bacterium]
MKKVLKVVGGILLALLLLLLILPFAFKGKIKDLAMQEANKQLKADVYMEDFSLSFFKNFPHASVTIENFGVVGRDEFQGDTLANVGDLTVVVNIASLFGDSYEINKVSLSDASVNAKVLENGKANWDIVASSDSTAEEPADTSASSPFNLSLNRLTVDNLNVRFCDMQSGMNALVDDLDLTLSGSFSQNDSMGVASLANINDMALKIANVSYADSSMHTSLDHFDFTFEGSFSEALAKLKTQLGMENLSFSMNKIPYLVNAKVTADIDVDADLNNNKFTFSENNIALNAIQANFDGYVQLIDSVTTDLDIRLNTPSIDFKQILSLIPAIYAKDFKDIKTDGKVSLQAAAKGRMQGETLPSFDVKLDVADAMFKYPSLPSSVDNINIQVAATNPGGVADLTVVDISKFNFVMAGNPFGMHLLLKRPVSDPDFDFGMKGTIDFQKLKEVVPLDSMELSGVLNTDITAKGLLSYVEQEAYDKFEVKGLLNLENMVIKTNSLPYDVNVSTANLDFSTKYVDLTSMKVQLGKNDLSAKGKLENFIPYVMKDEVLKGSLTVNSNFFNLNDFATESGEEANVQAEDSVAMTVVEIPANIDFAMNVDFKKLIYDKFELSDAEGRVTVKDQVLNISKLTTKMMGGSLNVTGSYDVRDVKKPIVDMDFGINNMTISEVFTKVETAKQFAPALSQALGNFSMNLKMNTALGEDMMPIFNSITGGGTFDTKEVQVMGVKALDKVAEKLNIKELSNPKLKNLLVKFAIKDGSIITEPFSTSTNGIKMDVSGSSKLDQTMDYTAAIAIPAAASKLPGKLNVASVANVKIGGTFTDPKISLDLTDVKEQVKEEITKVVDKAAQKALEEAKATQKKMLATAQTQADKIRSEAKSAGDKLVEDAEAQSAKMVKAAKNPIEKAAKKKAGESLVKEARKQADKLNADADKKANEIVANAQKSSDKIVKDAEAKANASK